jgi:GNS1/SUR4 family
MSGFVKVFKPYMTIIQLIQLIVGFVHVMVTALPSCGGSKQFYLQALNLFILIVLFGKFFIKNYTKTKKLI